MLLHCMHQITCERLLSVILFFVKHENDIWTFFCEKVKLKTYFSETLCRRLMNGQMHGLADSWVAYSASNSRGRLFKNEVSVSVTCRHWQVDQFPSTTETPEVFCFEMKLIQCVDVSNVIKSIQASVYNGDTFTILRDAFMAGLEVHEFVRRSTREILDEKV